MSSDYNCENCSDSIKRQRHCPFIPKDEWTGDFLIALKGPDNTAEILTECPKGFVLKHQDLLIYFQLKKWMDKGFPIYWGCGLMELPNKLVSAVDIIDSELGYVDTKNM